MGKQLSGAQKRKKKKEREEAIKEAAADMERLKLGPSEIWTGLVLHHKDIFVAPSKALAYSEISTVSTPSQKHPASFQVFNKDLHVFDVGLAHALTSGIDKHVETLGTLFVVSSARKGTPKSNNEQGKEKHSSFRKDRHRLHPRARTHNDRTEERR